MLKSLRLAEGLVTLPRSLSPSLSPSLPHSIPDDSCEAVPMESLEILLAFSIAHGNVNSILDCLYILLG